MENTVHSLVELLLGFVFILQPEISAIIELYKYISWFDSYIVLYSWMIFDQFLQTLLRMLLRIGFVLFIGSLEIRIDHLVVDRLARMFVIVWFMDQIGKWFMLVSFEFKNRLGHHFRVDKYIILMVCFDSWVHSVVSIRQILFIGNGLDLLAN